MKPPLDSATKDEITIGFYVPNVLFNKVALTGLFTVEPLPEKLEHSYTFIAFTRTRVIGALFCFAFLKSRDDPLKYIMSRPTLSGRIAKW